MSCFNAKTFFFFIVLIIVIALSSLFAQLYHEQLPLGGIALGIFIVAVAVAITLVWRLTNKLFHSDYLGEKNQVISAAELFSFTHDPATNLPTAQQAINVFNSALKSDTGQRYAAVVFQPINFQQVNGVLDYHNSELLLVQLAYCLQRKVSNNSNLLNLSVSPQPVRIARLQSLQFLVVYNLTETRFDDKSMLNDLCQQLGDIVPKAMSLNSTSLNFELAFGIAITEGNCASVDEIIAYASAVLLEGLKSQQQISYFDNSRIVDTQNQLARVESLRQDIQDEKILCYLKPQVNVKNHHIVGFQLRIHWYEGDATNPLELSDFSAIAEQGNQLYDLTKYMFKIALTTLATLHRIGVYQRISVVLSSESLFEVDLVNFIEQQLQKHEILGKYLMIELSEEIMLSASKRVKLIIDQLKSLDIKIAITDFSGSYESLRYVRKKAIHQLKINCQLLSNDSENRVDKAIINSLVTLTRSMKIPLVGTHVDRHDASEAYIAMGGELIEGDIIHTGVVPDEIEIWLEKWYLQHPESIPPEARPSIY